MKRISNGTYASLFGVVYLGLMTNVLLLVASFPLVALLITTDPSRSWPVLLIAAVLAAPGISAASSAFRAHAAGSGQVIRSFLAGWRATWRKALAIGAIAGAILAVVLVDVRFFSSGPMGVVVIPVLAVIAVLTLAASLNALVALSEVPGARLRDIAKAALLLSVRRWYLSIVSLGIIAVQAVLFSTMPAIAIGLSAAPALYLAWANARFTLRPALGLTEATPA